MVALAALSGLLAPGHAAALDPAPTAALGSVGVPASDDLDLDGATAERDRTTAELRGLDAEVQRAGDELAALDTAVLDASTTLAATGAAVVLAAAAVEEAQLIEREATAALTAANDALDDAVGRWRDDRDRLADRAIHAYKHGRGAGPSEVLVRGVAGAGDWHEVALTIETVARLSDDGRATVARAADATRDETSLRAAVDDARRDALAATTAAEARARELAALEARQAGELVALEAQQTERRVLLDRLEADVAVRTALLADLDARIARLEQAAARVLVPIVVDLDPYGPPPSWATGLPGQGPRWSAAIDATAQRHGLDPRLLAALVWTESNFRPDAVSHAGALGLAQLMPGTARGLGVDPRDPLANLDGGARYLRTQLDRFGRVDLALAAYNAGPGRVERVGRIPNIVETQLYVVRVLERYERLGG
ncbi:MAG: lytic transglycosylase domain-containing protein, partial [Nitriliruptoraceae bacterium]|nr:lytic transglycosylase domain-containing protein [Nitriliruptoraceae bacterium]